MSLQKHWIDSLVNGGGLIGLEDGTKWEVEINDRMYSNMWIEPEEVLLSPAYIDGHYNHTLTNCSNGEVVKVKQV